MKKFLNILAVAALLGGALSCEVRQEDSFSMDPVAPEMASHGDILITDNTESEDVNFTWSAYRNLPEGLTYTLRATYIYDTQVFATTNTTTWKSTKAEFKNMIYKIFPSLPKNDSFVLSFDVFVTDGEKEYASSTISFNVYANGEAVASEVSLVAETVELDPSAPKDNVNLLTWSPARLVFGEEVTYDVYLSVDGGQTRSLLASGLTGQEYGMTVDELNEAIVAAGGAEAAAVPVTFIVVAKCNTLSNGVESTSSTMNVTTYLATFPEKLYLPGSYQNWDPASAPTIAQSTAQKGFYEAIVDLTTADGSDVAFKFSPNPAWDGDFGGKVEAAKHMGYAGTVGSSDNITVPSGIYNLALDKKFGTITLVKYESLGIIGTAVGGWDNDAATLEYDPQAKTFSATVTLVPGEFKFRFNSDWDYSLGGELDNVTSQDGKNGNLVNDKEGEYKVVLDVSAAPYKVKFINTSFPDRLYIPGSHNGWAFTNSIAGDGEGHYEGFLNLGGEWGFKFTPAPQWGAEWGLDKTKPEPVDGEKGFKIYNLTDSDAGNIMEGSDGSYHKVIVDLTNLTVSVAPITSIGIIGAFEGNSWASDYASMTYNAESDSWKAKGVAIPKRTEWKFRMNGGWDINLGPVETGGSLENLVQDGKNAVETDGAVYDVELFISTTPYRAVLTKVGDVDAPDLPDAMYMVGEGIVDWNTFLPMTPLANQNGAFWAIRYIEAGKGFKFSPKPAWEGDFTGLDSNEGYTVDGGNCFVAESGIYAIGIDYGKGKVVVEPAKVYGIGEAFGGWDVMMDAAKYAASGKVLVGTASANGNMRTYVATSILDDPANWWHAELIVKDGQIVCRGAGGEPEAVALKAGQKVTLDFNAGTGTIE